MNLFVFLDVILVVKRCFKPHVTKLITSLLGYTTGFKTTFGDNSFCSIMKFFTATGLASKNAI